jgi:hypothetical protein
MYVNGKMIPVLTVPGMGEMEGYKRMVNSTMINLIYRKNFCRCHNVLPPSTKIKILKDFFSLMGIYTQNYSYLYHL